jgi:hypothetical protein
MPGLYLQKLTTRPPDDQQLEVAIVSLKAVLVPSDTPYVEGICDKDGNIVEPLDIEKAREEKEQARKNGTAEEKEQVPLEEEA